MLQYCELAKVDIYSYVPLTFHIKNKREDFEQFKVMYSQFQAQIDYIKGKLKEYDEQEEEEECNEKQYKEYESYLKFNKNVWIVKPGENTNRGNGILISKEMRKIELYCKLVHHNLYNPEIYRKTLLLIKKKI